MSIYLISFKSESNSISVAYIAEKTPQDSTIGFQIPRWRFNAWWSTQSVTYQVTDPITVGSFAFLFNCTPVGWTSDSMTVPIFNVAYSQQTTLAHELFCNITISLTDVYLPALLYLPSTTSFYASVSKGAFVCLFDLILYVHSTIFQLCGTVFLG